MTKDAQVTLFFHLRPQLVAVLRVSRRLQRQHVLVMAEQKLHRSFISRHLDDTEEQRTSVRKRNLLVLVLHYLEQQGLVKTAESLRAESTMKLEQYTLCDNIDLELILQEFETFQFVKFRKQPHITKKTESDVQGTQTNQTKTTKTRVAQTQGSQQSRSSSFSGSFRFKALHRLESGDEKLKSDSISLKGKLMADGSFCAENVSIDRRLGIQISSPTAPQLRLPHMTSAALGSDWLNLVDIISKDIYMESPNVFWKDIVGLDSAKRLIKEALVYPMKYPDIFSGIIGPWKGLLLFGPPGTGKTMLAKAVATECKTTFFNITASTLISKWRGESEKLVRVLFEMARQNSPSTIFLDELDALVGSRGQGIVSSEHEASRRMKSELLIQMDGLVHSKDLVFVLAASNAPWDLDLAVLRRLEKRILVPLPGKDARGALFHRFLAGPHGEKWPENAPDIDYDCISEAAEGYSGSDIRVACKEALMSRFRRALEEAERSDVSATAALSTTGEASSCPIALEPVTTSDVLEAVAQTRPTSHSMAAQYEAWHRNFGSALS
ncbi:katanin p60 ATPase-containing subunit A-like 2 isoform X2 [Ornithodoros turicata]